MNWYFQVLKKYAVFSGRARRKEYWYFILFNGIICFVLGLIEGLAFVLRDGKGALITPEMGEMSFSVLAGIYALAVLLPSIGVSIRRLHDTGRGGWWLLISLIPLVGSIILLIYMVANSQEGTNQYGPSPKNTILVAP